MCRQMRRQEGQLKAAGEEAQRQQREITLRQGTLCKRGQAGKPGWAPGPRPRWRPFQPRCHEDHQRHGGSQHEEGAGGAVIRNAPLHEGDQRRLADGPAGGSKPQSIASAIFRHGTRDRAKHGARPRRRHAKRGQNANPDNQAWRAGPYRGQNQADGVNHRTTQSHAPGADLIRQSPGQRLAHAPKQIMQRYRRAIGKGRNGVFRAKRQQEKPKGLSRPKC